MLYKITKTLTSEQNFHLFAPIHSCFLLELVDLMDNSHSHNLLSSWILLPRSFLIVLPLNWLTGALDTRCWISTKIYDEFLSILMNKIDITTHNDNEKRILKKKRKKRIFCRVTLCPQTVENFLFTCNCKFCEYNFLILLRWLGLLPLFIDLG